MMLALWAEVLIVVNFVMNVTLLALFLRMR